MIAWLKGAGLTWRVRVLVVVLTLAVGVAIVKVAPYPTHRLRWLATYHTSSSDPAWDIPVNGAAFRRAAAHLRGGETYTLWYPAVQKQYSHDLLGAGLLFLQPALPVLHASDADWVIDYRRPGTLPPGVRAGARTPLGPGIDLARVAH